MKKLLMAVLLCLAGTVHAEDFTAKLEFDFGGAINLTDRVVMGSMTVGGVKFQDFATLRFGSFMAEGHKTLWGPTIGIDVKALISKIPGAVYQLPLQLDLSYAPVIDPFSGTWAVKHLFNVTAVKF